MSTLNAKAVVDAIMAWPGAYQTPDGRNLAGSPVSEVPTRLREAGWRRVSGLDEHDFKALGLEVVDARYVGGVRPKRFCRVVVARWRDYAGDVSCDRCGGRNLTEPGSRGGAWNCQDCGGQWQP